VIAVTAELERLVRRALADGSRLRGELDVAAIARAAVVMRDAVLAGRKVLLIGNGGSAADAQHIAAELVGRFVVECLDPDEYRQVALLERKYADLDLGLADAATVVLAARFRTRRVLTFDERHFRAVTPLQGGAFELLPQR